jgi:hypothetical protein
MRHHPIDFNDRDKQMTIQDRNPPARHPSVYKSPGMESGKEAEEEPPYETLPTERVDLANPEPEHEREIAQNHAHERPLLPHERDETTRHQSTGLGNENERSRAVIGQAAEDTEHGLRDTDLHGIPSDIIAWDIVDSDVPEKPREKKR